MSEPHKDFSSCAVCGRTILRGERAIEYVDTEGAEAAVCVLCMPRAEAAGWILASAAPPPAPPGPARKRGGAATALRERFTRRTQPAATGERAAAPEPQAEPEPARAATPFEVFNASSEVRKVAGLRRSLGEPRVSLRPAERGAQLITVAWELSWYQWSVEGERIRQVAKGNEISELPIEDRAWNATAAEDGTLAHV